MFACSHVCMFACLHVCISPWWHGGMLTCKCECARRYTDLRPQECLHLPTHMSVHMHTWLRMPTHACLHTCRYQTKLFPQERLWHAERLVQLLDASHHAKSDPHIRSFFFDAALHRSADSHICVAGHLLTFFLLFLQSLLSTPPPRRGPLPICHHHPR